MNHAKVKIFRLDNLINACFNVYQEIGKQVGEPRTILLRKIISNLECINELLAEQFTHEILIILRSAIETIILFCYLTTHLDKEQEYILDSELLELKNTFILVKNRKKDIDTESVVNLDLQEAFSYHEEIFNKHLSQENKEYVLKKLNLKEYKLTLENLNNIDSFFRNDKRIKKPFFMNIEQMLAELPKFEEIGAELRDLIYSDYNLNSQVTHGQYHLWSRGLVIEERFLKQVKSQIVKVVTYPLFFLKGQVKIDLNNLAKLKSITDQLIIDIYKDH